MPHGRSLRLLDTVADQVKHGCVHGPMLVPFEVRRHKDLPKQEDTRGRAPRRLAIDEAFRDPCSR